MSFCPLGRPNPKHGHLLKAAKLHQCILLLVLTHAILAAACSRSSLKGSGSLVVTKKDDTEKKQKLIDEIVAILELYTDERVVKAFQERAASINATEVTDEELRALLSRELTVTLGEQGVSAQKAAPIVMEAAARLLVSATDDQKEALFDSVAADLAKSYQEFSRTDPTALAELIKKGSNGEEVDAEITELVQQTPLKTQTAAQPEPTPAERLAFLSFSEVSARAGEKLKKQPEVVATGADGRPSPDALRVKLSLYRDASCEQEPLSDEAWSIDSDSRLTVGGVVSSYTGLTVFQPGVFYLKATALSISGAEPLAVKPACSEAITIAPPAAGARAELDALPTRLGFLASAEIRGSAGASLTESLQVAVYDVYGFVVPSGIFAISLTAHTDPSCSDETALTFGDQWSAGSELKYAFGGLAAFDTVTFDSAGVYYLRANAEGLADACGPPITVSEILASAVKLTGVPASVTNGRASLAIWQADIVDALGVRVSVSRGVSLEFSSDSNCSLSAGKVTGATGTTVAGRVKLDEILLTVPNPPPQVYVRAVSGNLASSCQGPIALISPTPTRLRFTQTPPLVLDASVPLTGSVGVAMVDEDVKIVSGSPAEVSVASFQDPTCNALTPEPLLCNGKAENCDQLSEDGRVSFSGLTFQSVGQVYLGATSTGLSSACFGPLTSTAVGIVAQLSGAPESISTTSQLNVTVSGASGEKYRHLLLVGELSCLGRTAQFDALPQGSSVSTVISEPLPNDGVYTLCVRGEDGSGNKQLLPTRHSFTVDTTPPFAVLLNTPNPITTDSALNVSVSGAGVDAYRYAMVPGTTCAGANYSAFYKSTEPISDLLQAGEQSLCVVGQDAAGNIQSVADATRHTFSVTGRFPPAGQLLVETVGETVLRVFHPRPPPGKTLTLVYAIGANAPGPNCAAGNPVSNLSASGETLVAGLFPSTTYAFRACLTGEAGDIGVGVTADPGFGNPADVLCDSGTPDTTCVVSQSKALLLSGKRYVVRGDLTIESGAVLAPSTTSPRSPLELFVGGTLTVRGTLTGNFQPL